MNWRQIPSFERLPLRQIIARNPERREAMWDALGKAAAQAFARRADRETRIELMREAIRPFDLYAHQRGELPQ